MIILKEVVKRCKGNCKECEIDIICRALRREDKKKMESEENERD